MTKCTDRVPYNQVLNCLARQSEPELDTALTLLKQMDAAGIARDVITYNALMSVCEDAATPAAVLELFRRACAEGVQPDKHTFTRVIRAHG